MVQQVICQLHCIWKNTNSCEFMGAHARSSAHGCPWMYMVVHACVWVFMCFCLFVVLFCCHPLSLNLKVEMEVPALGWFLSWIIGNPRVLEGPFWNQFGQQCGSSSFIKTNCQDWMAFHLSKAVVGQKNEESPGEDWLYSFFLQKLNGQSSPDLINH